MTVFLKHKSISQDYCLSKTLKALMSKTLKTFKSTVKQQKKFSCCKHSIQLSKQILSLFRHSIAKLFSFLL